MRHGRISSSIRWVAALRYTIRSTELIKLVILSRILSPVDFGLFSLATVSINILESLSDTGFAFAFIHRQGNIDKYAKTLLVINGIRGLALSLISLLISLPLALFFNQLALLPLLILMSTIPTIRGFTNPAIIVFQMELDFRKEFFYKIIPSLLSVASSVFLCMILKNSLGLALGVLVGALAETSFSYLICKTHFSSPYSGKKARKLFAYGKSLTIGGIFSYLMTQIDNVFIGKVFGVGALGQYDLLFKLGNISFSEITDVISRVTFPYFAKIKKDKKLLIHKFLQNIFFVTIPAAIFALLFILHPKEVILLFFGSQWVNGSAILQILAIYGFVRAIVGPLGPLFLAIGKPQVLTTANILNFFGILLLIFPLANLYGLNGVTLTMLTSYLLSCAYMLYYLFVFFRGNLVSLQGVRR